MLKFINMKEVCVCVDIAAFANAKQALEEKSIPFKTDIVRSGVYNRTLGSVLGKAGEKEELSTMYYIYVHKRDYAEAERIIEAKRDKE